MPIRFIALISTIVLAGPGLAHYTSVGRQGSGFRIPEKAASSLAVRFILDPELNQVSVAVPVGTLEHPRAYLYTYDAEGRLDTVTDCTPRKLDRTRDRGWKERKWREDWV